MAFDELHRLSGTTGNPQETVTTTANGTSVFYGANRYGEADLIIGGTVSGTSPTLDIKLQEGTASGGTYTDVVSFPQQTASMSGETGGGRVTVGFKTSKDYIRIAKTVGGTSPSFAGVQVLVRPFDHGRSAS